MIKNRDIIIFGDDWGRHPSSIQHIAWILAKTNRILWVNSVGLRRPRLALYDIRRIFGKIIRMFFPTGKMKSKCPFIQIFPLVLPFYDLKIIKMINTKILEIQIRRKIKKLNFTKFILLVSTPVVVDLVGVLGEVSSYYLCFDDYSSFINTYKSINSMENKILACVNGSFFISDALLRTKKCKSEENHFLPQGVDYEHFSCANYKIPEKIKNIKKPIVGFFGLISNWIDLDLIRSCAIKYSYMSFMLIGKVDTDVSQLLSLKNVFLFGAIPYEQLPAYAKRFNVGIIPFVINELTKAANPIKMLEYFSLGIPVVSSDLPEMLKFKEHLYIAANKEDFIKYIKCAIDEDDLEKKKERQRIARKYSWHFTCEILSNHIQRIEKKSIGNKNS